MDLPIQITRAYIRRHDLSQSDLRYLFDTMSSRVMWLLAIQSGIDLAGCAIRMSCADPTDVLITNKSIITGKLLYILQPDDTVCNKIDSTVLGHTPCLPIHTLPSAEFRSLKLSFVPCVSIHHNRTDTVFHWKECIWIAVTIDSMKICAARIQLSNTPTYRVKQNIYAHKETSVLFEQELYMVTEEFTMFLLGL
jgi:hypothetical protein